MRVLYAVAGTMLCLSGCVSSKISSIPTSASPVAVHVIAIAPGGGILADAVGGELSNRGFRIVDPGSTSRIVGRSNLNEFEVTRPESMLKLRDQGVDAVLSVQTAGGYDQQPQSASARITSTYTGQLISAVSWQNGWGGQRNSIADRQMRSGLIEAAADIAKGVASNIRQEAGATPQPLPVAATVTAPIAVAGIPAGTGGEKYGYAAAKTAKDQRCVADKPPTLVASGPGFETFSVTCSVGEPMMLRCEFGNCRALR